MIGCLAWPVRLLLVLGLLAAGALGWMYRGRVVREVRALWEREVVRAEPAAASPVPEAGRASPAALRSARLRIDSLERKRADSVVLGPAEAASLLDAAFDAPIRRHLDSLELVLGEGTLTIGGVVQTARLPLELVGPLAVALREREPIEASGALAGTARGRAEWRLREVAIRGIPVPDDVVPSLIAKAFGDSTRTAIPLDLPPGVARVRAVPNGLILHRTASP